MHLRVSLQRPNLSRLFVRIDRWIARYVDVWPWSQDASVWAFVLIVFYVAFLLGWLSAKGGVL